MDADGRHPDWPWELDPDLGSRIRRLRVDLQRLADALNAPAATDRRQQATAEDRLYAIERELNALNAGVKMSEKLALDAQQHADNLSFASAIMIGVGAVPVGLALALFSISPRPDPIGVLLFATGIIMLLLGIMMYWVEQRVYWHAGRRELLQQLWDETRRRPKGLPPLSRKYRRRPRDASPR